jgi:hypothetical protein
MGLAVAKEKVLIENRCLDGQTIQSAPMDFLPHGGIHLKRSRC